MKLVAIFIFLASPYAQSQEINSTFGDGLSNIYNDALARFVSIVKKQDASYKRYLDTLFVEENNFIRQYDLPLTIKKIPVAVT